MKLLHTSRLLTAASVLAFAANMNAADLTIAQGSDPVTIYENSTYDAVVVNGDLTVAAGVTLSCTSLTVADGISGTATLTVGDGGWDPFTMVKPFIETPWISPVNPKTKARTVVVVVPSCWSNN